MQRNVGAFNLEDDEEGGEEEGAVGEGVGDNDEVEPVLDDLGLPEVDPARVNYPVFKREVWAAVDRAFRIEKNGCTFGWVRTAHPRVPMRDW
uniref:Uncharacterized protein n=1 Tax=Chromera velia CCMP2878 TaxID=1169474 RepID=A0A0G4HYA4_9ALVE|eukprot:Cvel_33504.t1-p1 / transcript=Cvel_33504.t1 / gene=Cvel_33504 / organism=Chromera_velia_CCMP2878 / gene_product=hypothetical protein / transcript_product=hypothetical protein / location=Cvel_scaffold5461:1165-1437(+) / protein_length=91 / sequence_SO=supercontig / SO=protein_coding / is_pseudo=false